MKRVCVYCGLSSGKHPVYLEQAKILAQEMVQRNLELIYGGGSLGLMGAVAELILERGGSVIGIIPKHLRFPEMVHQGLTKLHVVNSMHERKALMADLSDAFIALPGGPGTTEEILEVLTWAQLGLHHKPCGLLNTLGYYDHLLSFLKHAVNEKFLQPEHCSMLIVEKSIPKLFERFNSS